MFQILNVSAVVLANLCASYAMTNQNEQVSHLTTTTTTTTYIFIFINGLPHLITSGFIS